jgi:cytidylate kinase
MKQIIISIDGYSSCGKSTLARQLAARLHYLYIDSGAMYRALTLYFIENNVDWHRKRQVAQALENVRLEFLQAPSGNHEIHLNGQNVESKIRDMVVAEKVSEVATIGEVRQFAVSQQRLMGAKKGIVMDGRDIGTVVFPQAELKIFMQADMTVRVERRFRELFAKYPQITLQQVKENIELRDYLDSNREISPLRKAEDAIVLDNSAMNEAQQLNFALDLVKKIAELSPNR